MTPSMVEDLAGYLLILLAIVVGMRGILKGEFFRPRTLFMFVHPLAMGFALLNLFWTENGFGWMYFATAISSWAAFLFGCIVAEKFVLPPVVKPMGYNHSHSWITWLIPIFGCMGLFLLSRLGGGWPIFSPTPETARMKMISGRATAFLFSFAVFSMVFSIDQALLQKRKLFFVGALVVMVFVGLTGNRGQIFMASIVGISLIETSLRKNIGLKAVVSGAIFVVVFLLIGFVRLKDDNPLNESLSVFTGLKMVYVYMTNGQWNLSVGIEKVARGMQSFTWGTSSFNGIFYWFSDPIAIQRSLGWDTVMNESVKKYPGLNSTSFQWAFIKDFGITGMLIITFSIGYFLSRLYLHARGYGWASILSAFLSYPLMFSFNILWLVEGTGSMVGILLVGSLIGRRIGFREPATLVANE